MNKQMFNPANPQVVVNEVIASTATMIRTWSASTLKKFESCEWAVFLQYVQKIPEKKSDAGDRGSMIHSLAEEYVKGEIAERPKELDKIGAKIDWLKDRFAEGIVAIEEDWGFDLDWAPAPWVGPTTWGRAKLDAFVRLDEVCALVIDHKTGKKFGNEMPHTTQGMIYAIAAFMRYPELEFIQVKFWYIDHGEEMTIEYTRANAMVLLPRIKARALKLTTCTTFKPKPSATACRFCSYKEEACEWAHQG